MTRVECSQTQSHQTNLLTELGCFVEKSVLNPLQERIDQFVKASLLVYDQFAKLVDAPPVRNPSQSTGLRRVENYRSWDQKHSFRGTYSQREAEAIARYTSGPIRIKPKEAPPPSIPRQILSAYAAVGELPFRAIGAFQGCNKSSEGGSVGSINHAPEIADVPQLTVEVGKNLSHIIGAFDEDGDDLVFSFANEDNLPQGITLDSDTGQLDWTPAEDQIGFYQIVISISDGQEETYQTISIEVTEAEPTCVTLEDEQIYYVKEDTTFCPGTYNKAHIIIEGVQNIVVKGENVTLHDRLEGELVANRANGQSISIKNSSNITISGFKIDAEGGLGLSDSNHNTIKNLVFTEEVYHVMVFGSDNLFMGIKIYSGRYGGLYYFQGDDNTIKNSMFINDSECGPAYRDLAIEGTVVVDDILVRGGFDFSLGDNNILRNSEIDRDRNCIDLVNSAHNSALSVGSNNEVYSNIIKSKGIGISVFGNNNKIYDNDLTMAEIPIDDYTDDNQIYNNAE